MSAYDTVRAARNLLETLTPLKTDCGRLCQGACCQGDEQTGMLLFPGEEAFYERIRLMLCEEIEQLSGDPDLLQKRYERFRRIGSFREELEGANLLSEENGR